MKKKIYRMDIASWHLDRKIYLIAGIFVAVSVMLGIFQDKNWLYFTLFVGLMLVNFAVTGYCPLAIILARGSKNK